MRSFLIGCFLLLSFPGIVLSSDEGGKAAGTIVSVRNGEILVKYIDAARPFKIGERVFAMSDEQSVVLESMFPMQATSKCRVISGNPDILRQGMMVFEGTGIRNIPKSSSAAKGKDEEFSLPGNVRFRMKDAMVPAGRVRFPIGAEDRDLAEIGRKFYMAETETTYELWKAVFDWAVSNNYAFSNKGQSGYNTDNEIYQPVTNISWRDCIVWCNALTEYVNRTQGGRLVPVYVSGGLVIRDSADSRKCDSVVPDPNANGFRLPVSNEWEYCARYRGADPVNSVLMDGLYWTKGDSASGAALNSEDLEETGRYGWYKANSGFALFTFGKTHKPKEKQCNALGIYDMSGNVWEWCFDASPLDPSRRVARGGAFLNDGKLLRISSLYGRGRLGGSDGSYGFRIARTK